MGIFSRAGFAANKYFDRFPTTYNVWIIACFATVSGSMFGFDVSSISAFLSDKNYLDFFDSPGSTQQGLITGSTSAGSFLGAIVSSMISEDLGRRLTLLIASLLWILGAIVQCSCRNLGQLVVGRIISGTGIGLSSAVSPIYCSEVSPASFRGVIGGGYQLAVTFGILVMFYIGYGCTFIDGNGSFRLAWALQMIPGIALFFGVFLIPESPRWLANHDDFDRAKEVLAKINKNERQKDYEKEIEELHSSVLIFKTSKEITYLDLFNSKNLKSTIVGVSAQIWNQLSGMNVMMYYVVYIFKMVGFSGNRRLVSSSIQYVVNFVVTLASLPLTEYVGRRRLMIFGGVMMMVWLFIVGGLFAQYSVPIKNAKSSDTINITIPNEHKAVGKAIVASVYLFVATFASTWAVTSWAYFSEVLPTRTRSKAGSLAVAADWAMNFAIALFIPPAFKNITWKTYFIFGTFCGAMSIHAFLAYPETRRKTLEEIDMIFQQGIPAWRTNNLKLIDLELFDYENKSKVEHVEESNESV